MANVLLTQRCVRSCPYCFAKKHMSGSVPDDIMKWEDIVYIADLADASNEKHLSLLGGEPTLHPDFVDIVLYLLERGLHVNVFTSAIMSEKMLEDAKAAFQKVSPRDLSFVINLNDPKINSFAELQSVHAFMKAFSRFSNVGFNIYRTDFDMTFLFDHIMTYGLKPVIRLGVAHRIPGIKNMHIAPGMMRPMIDQLMKFMPTMERLGIMPGFDCGFPLCEFSNEELGYLMKIMSDRLKFGCGPAIDIGPDMTVWTCFPLSSYHKKSIYEFDSFQAIGKYYHEFQNKVREEIGGIYDECTDCKYRKMDLCRGGCIAHILHEFINEEQVRPEEVYK